MAMAIDDVRVTLGIDRVSLIGSSYGGFLSLLYAHRNPDSVASLILADTSASYGFRQESLAMAKQRGTPSMLRALEHLWNGSLESDEDFHADWREILPLCFYQFPREAIERIADHSSYRLETRKQILPSLRDYDLRAPNKTVVWP
jgi:proline iminopeptidase